MKEIIFTFFYFSATIIVSLCKEGEGMSIKQFVQLFVLYFLSIVIAVPLTNLLKVDNALLSYFIISVIGYVTLTLPLTIMTIKKEKNK